jgi:hypothetical protein
MWRQFLSQPRAIGLLALLGMAMLLPTLKVGFMADDFMFGELLSGRASQAHPGAFFGLFTFADGNPDNFQALKASGQYPWWVADNPKLQFWRPLAELSHWLDYELWPDSPALMHAHTVLWYGLLVWLLGHFYRKLDPDGLRTGLATLIFAVSTMHLLTVIWLAARNQLMAGCFLLLTLMSFHHWREGRGTRHALAALLTLVLGLLSAEAAIATLAYLLAYVVAFEQGQGKPMLGRLMSLLPFVLVVLAWRLLYNHLGYGSTGSGGYIDPGADLGRFGLAVLERLPTLLLAGLFGVSSSLLNLLPVPVQPFYATAAAVAVLLSALVGQFFRLWETPLARFHGLGALLSLVPVCAAITNDRLLLNAEFGLCALLAMLFAHVLARHRRYMGKLARAAKLAVAVLMVVHLLIFPLVSTSLSVVVHALLRVPAHDEPMSLPDAGPHSRDRVMLVNPPNALFVGYYPMVRRYFGVNNAASMQAMASGDQPLTLTVLDTRTIRLSAPRGFGDAVSRDFIKHPFKAGDVVSAGHVQVSVEAVTDFGKPQVARFRFDVPLRDAPWQFYAWGDEGYERFELPRAGQSVTVARAGMGKLMKRRLSASLRAIGVH